MSDYGIASIVTRRCLPTANPSAPLRYLVWASAYKLPSNDDAHFGHLPGCLRYPVLQRDKHHQAGKPTDLMRQLVKVCPPGGTVLDPFAGSATTGVAALLEGMNFVGCEVVPEYAAIARKRLAEAEVSTAAMKPQLDQR